MALYNSSRMRKTYAVGRSQPPRPTFVILGGHTEYFDAASAAVDYSFYSLQAVSGVIGNTQYEENVINFVGETNKTITFQNPFISAPIVTLELISADPEANISASLGVDSPTEFTARLSAPFTGQIVYRAVRATAYPTRVYRTPVSAAAIYDVDAGFVDLANSSDTALTYIDLPDHTVTAKLFVTVTDVLRKGNGGVGIVAMSPQGLTTTPVSLSAPITNRLNYIVVKEVLT